MNAQKLKQLTTRSQHPFGTLETPLVIPCQIPNHISPILSRTNSSLQNFKKINTYKNKNAK